MYHGRLVRLMCLLLGMVLLSHAVSPLAAQSQAKSEAPVGNAADYTLGIADKLRVTVFGEEALTGEFPISANGTIALPLVGEIKAAGLTAGELRGAIQRELSAKYLRDPRVSVDVLTFRPYFILGEVTKPGQYPSAAGTTVLNAVATAQGFTYRANTKYVFLKRVGESVEKRVRLTPDLKVMPGDTVRVGERFF